MSFAPADVLQLHAANVRQAMAVLSPDTRFSTSKYGLNLTAAQMPDDVLVSWVDRTRAGRTASALTRRQVGESAWREFRNVYWRHGRTTERKIGRGIRRVGLQRFGPGEFAALPDAAQRPVVVLGDPSVFERFGFAGTSVSAPPPMSPE